MSGLLAQQQALVRALFDTPAQDAMKNIANLAIDTGARGLKAYQSNGHALARRTLSAAYPVVTQLLGQDSMDDLARALWHAQPPVRGDLAQWGDGLGAFMAESPQLRDTPYLPDIARLEWALHQAAGAADQLVDASSFSLLASHDPNQLTLQLAPGAGVVPSAWPVVAIWAAHQPESPGFEEVRALMDDGIGQTAVYWRQGFRPKVRLAMPGEAEALSVLLAQGDLGAALDAAPALDVAAWLPLAVQTGLLLAVHVRAADPDPAVGA
ncbi:MAG: putative DNA-binding domain-containing protein [Rhodoferax sp.]|uniref:HvfC/BufC family peptide modification chaperone n=1 Tax=Rhodoferax sp. TaxID=50421 RepID=UPI002ACEBFB6|nr:putative DNA-binding domain-containing protein [Rhodoferax sp.]MDZ7890681.1 putative DNA-binding domain-containing protein [Rhodoferax sp.]